MPNTQSPTPLLGRPATLTVCGGLLLAAVPPLIALLRLPLVPIALVLPFFGHIPIPLLVVAPAIAFWSWSHQLFSGDPEVPTRSFIALGVLCLFDLVWFAVAWRDGVRYQGLPYVLAFAGGNLLVATLVWLLGLWAQRNTSFRGSLLFHLAVPLWFITIAMPYLGEWP